MHTLKDFIKQFEDCDFINVRHTVNPGDIIASMISCKKLYEITGKKINFMQKIGRIANYYPGAMHETKNALGDMVCVNQNIFDMIKPLVDSQEYINETVAFNSQRIDIDFDDIRGKTFVNVPMGAIQSWLFYAFPQLASDITDPWITINDSEDDEKMKHYFKDKIIVNFTSRYRSGIMGIDYGFLKKYSDNVIFCGTKQEHTKFMTDYSLNIERYEVPDFLVLAKTIKYSRFILCNQSFMWNIAQAMGTPRLLEVCNYAANCMPFFGEKNYGYFHQDALLYYFNELYAGSKKRNP